MDCSDDRSSPELPRRILVVEHNPEDSFIAVTVLRQLLGDGPEIIIADNAHEAFYLLHHFTAYDRPDLILVDLRLPDDSGLDVLAAARAHEHCAQIPTFVITRSIHQDDVVQSYQLGASAVLNQPLSRAGLREELVRTGNLTARSSLVHTTSH
jgi:CheY-like chemotaxis protein